MKTFNSLTESWASQIGILEGLENASREEKLKQVLDLAKQTVAVIFPAENFIVKWIDGQTRSSLVSHIITLNPDPLFNEKSALSFLERVDVIVGEAILNSGHRKSAIQAAEVMLRLWGQNKVKESIAFQIWTAAELSYSEKVILEEFPGYAGYFAAHRKYYLTEEKRAAIQATIDATKEQTNLAVCVSIIVWELLSEVDNLKLKSYFTPVYEVLRKFQAEQKMSCFDRAYTASRATDWLLDYYREWEEYEKSLEKQAKEEAREQAKKKQEKTDKKKQEGKEKSDENEEGEAEGQEGQEGSGSSDKSLEELIDECPSAEDLGISKILPNSKELSQQEIEEANSEEKTSDYIDDFDFDEELEEEDEEEEETCKPKNPAKREADSDSKIKEYNHSQQLTVAEQQRYQQELLTIRPFIPPILNSLKFRNEEQKFKEYGLKRGNVDAGSLAKLSYQDYNVFEREEIISKPKVHITLLIDESGSMGCSVRAGKSRADLARESAILLATAIKKIEGVNLSIYGHSSTGTKCAFYRYHDRENIKLDYLGQITARSENYDGYAIEHAGKLTLKQAQPDAYKLLIHISDGQPAAPSYGGKPAMNHVRKVVQKLISQHVQILAVGIGGVSDEDMSLMYNMNYLNIHAVQELPQKLTKLVSQIIRKQ